MSDIKISRYPALQDWSGAIEGADDQGNSWIIFLDSQGRPGVYWPEREESGAVVGDPISLS